ncbi:DNA polymerase III delta subunit [Scopulibacillus darangshiensis]|uniref:DNA polymerase III subunit delta n=1 Tax=Scopulibacillus darangshiensis TaxID=442528 RepID=A0A4V2SNT7_9BACL|nr:DNA polymerase III subunit delta [Scopulibacillus darangshiensis]TCP32326.1 DNA polymerase III delta subunit [Scopulibacillus darangshiensis]
MALTQKDLTVKKPLAPVYLLFGKQSYLIQFMKESIVNEALNKDEKDFNLSVYDMTESPVEAAVEDAETLPFIGEKRVVIIENPHFLSASKVKSKVDHDLKRLEQYINEPSPDSIFIILAMYDKLDQRKKIVKLARKQGITFELSQLTNDLLFNILETAAKKYNALYTRDGHDQLLAMVGPNLMQLVSEVEKFALYCGDERPIDKSVVIELGARSLENNIFNLVDMVMKKQPVDAYKLLADLIKQKEEPIKLLAIITRQLRIVYQVGLYQQEGYTQKNMAAKLGIHPYAVKLAAGQTKLYHLETLKRALAICAETDYKMKTGAVEKKLALEMLIHKLAK